MVDRGGIKSVRRHSTGHPTHFNIFLEFRLFDLTYGSFGFRVGAKTQGGYEVQAEECKIYKSNTLTPEIHYSVVDGKVIKSSAKVAPVAAGDRLYLVNASGLPEFRPLYEALSHMGFYNLNPESIRELQQPDAGELLDRHGSNLASVLGQLKSQNPLIKKRIEEYLSKVVPGIQKVDNKSIGPKETLEFFQYIGNNESPWKFLAQNMSDGTLRALGILVALFQAGENSSQRASLVGIEEPEAALHPAAAGILRDSLLDASKKTQVIVTSHSPDLLDDDGISDESIVPIVNEFGESRIAPLDEAGRSAIRDRLYTPGELLRLNQLIPENGGSGLDKKSSKSNPERTILFGDGD